MLNLVPLYGVPGIPLRKRAINQTSKLAKQWSTLLSDYDQKSIDPNLDNRLNDIVLNDSKSLLIKMEEVEAIWREQQNKASERFKIAHNERDSALSRKNTLDSKKQMWNSIFIWLQILGLIILSSIEIIDKFIEKGS